MIPPFIGTLLGGLASSLFGGGGSSAPPPASDAFGSAPGNFGLTSNGDQAASGGGLFGNVAGMLESALAQRTIGGYNARSAGRNQLAYLKAAFPGVPIWELTGASPSGAQIGSGTLPPELLQRERESKRSAQVALQTSRMSASAGLAAEAMRAAGSGNGPLVAMLLRSGGILPPGVPFSPSLMARGRPEAEVANVEQETARSRALLEPDIARTRQETATSQASEFNTRQDTDMAPYEFVLREWDSKYGKSYTANEARGISEALRETISMLLTGGGNSSFSRDMAESMSKLPFKSVAETKWLLGMLDRIP